MTLTANHKPGFFAWLALTVFCCGCAGGLFSDGYETYPDVNGEVVGVYPTDFDRTVQTGIKALADIEGTVLSRTVEGQETIVQARGADGSPLRLRFVKEGHRLTVVRVRTGLLGYQNQAYSNQFHVYLAARLKHRGRSPTAASNTGGSASPFAESPAAVGRPKATSGPAAGSAPDAAGGPNQKIPTMARSGNSTMPVGESESARAAKPSKSPETDRDAPATLASRADPKSTRPDYVIFFDKNSNIPPPEALEVLNKAADRMKAGPDTVIAISGFADTDEDPREMHLVSESRTLAVKSYLIGKGISSRRIRTAWHGSQFAKTVPEDKSQHRRVEIRLMRGL